MAQWRARSASHPRSRWMSSQVFRKARKSGSPLRTAIARRRARQGLTAGQEPAGRLGSHHRFGRQRGHQRGLRTALGHHQQRVVFHHQHRGAWKARLGHLLLHGVGGHGDLHARRVEGIQRAALRGQRLAGNQVQRLAGGGLGEVDDQRAWHVQPQPGDDHVGAALQQVGDDIRPPRLDELELHAQVVGQLPRNVHAVTHQTALPVLHHHRRHLHHTHAQHPALANRGQGVHSRGAHHGLHVFGRRWPLRSPRVGVGRARGGRRRALGAGRERGPKQAGHGQPNRQARPGGAKCVHAQYPVAWR